MIKSREALKIEWLGTLHRSSPTYSTTLFSSYLAGHTDGPRHQELPYPPPPTTQHHVPLPRYEDDGGISSAAKDLGGDVGRSGKRRDAEGRD